MCNLYPLLKLTANSAFRGKYCHQKSAKLNIGQPYWIDLANKGMVKKGCTLIWQSESTKQTLPKPQKARYDYRY